MNVSYLFPSQSCRKIFFTTVFQILHRRYSYLGSSNRNVFKSCLSQKKFPPGLRCLTKGKRLSENRIYCEIVV